MGTNHSAQATAAQKPDAESEILRLVRDALDRLRFGSIHLTIHEGKLVQIDVTEKTRLPA